MRVSLASSLAMLALVSTGMQAAPSPPLHDTSLPSHLTHTVWHHLTRWLVPRSSSSQRPFSLPRSPSPLSNDTHPPSRHAASPPRFVLYGDQPIPTQSFGAPPAHLLSGFTVFNLAFWTAQWGAADNAAKYAAKPAAERAWFHARYAAAGIKLVVSLFGADDRPQSLGRNATALAAEVGAWVRATGLDGVDIDYEEMQLFEQGSAVAWLVELTQALRAELPSPRYVLTHAPIAPWFSTERYGDGGYTAVHRQVGELVDWYNVQFYNQETYESCETLLWDAGAVFPQTALFEINRYYGIPLDKLVVGKPAGRADAGSGWMRPDVLGECLGVARENGWNAGVMFWEYPNMTPEQLKVVRDAAGF